MHKILVIRLYFLLDALHVSDCISPSSGATLYYKIKSNHKNFVHLVGLYRYSKICQVMAINPSMLTVHCTDVQSLPCRQPRYTVVS